MRALSPADAHVLAALERYTGCSYAGVGRDLFVTDLRTETSDGKRRAYVSADPGAADRLLEVHKGE